MGGYCAVDAMDELQTNEDQVKYTGINEWMSDTGGICVGLYTAKQLISGCLSGKEAKP